MKSLLLLVVAIASCLLVASCGKDGYGNPFKMQGSNETLSGDAQALADAGRP
jgi:hypothetical protein